MSLEINSIGVDWLALYIVACHDMGRTDGHCYMTHKAEVEAALNGKMKTREKRDVTNVTRERIVALLTFVARLNSFTLAGYSRYIRDF